MKPLIPHTKWEKSKKQQFQNANQPFQRNVERGNGKGYDFNNFSQDMFSALYQSKPEFPEDATPGASWAKKALDELQNLAEFKDIRKQGTVCDSLQAGLGASCLTKHFAESLPNMPDQNPDELEQQIKNMEEFLQEFPGNEKIQNQLTAAKNDLPGSQKAWQEMTEKMDDAGLRRALRKAIGEYQEASKQMQDAIDGLGYGKNPGDSGIHDPAQAMQLAAELEKNPKLKEIIKLAGRFRREAKKVQANKKRPGPDELTDIEVGNDIERLIPSELMKLADEDLELDFFKKYLERGQIQYKLEEKQKDTKGPVVVCIDNSGSMYGQKEVWSKAIALAMCQIAMDQKRDFSIIHFDSSVTRQDNFEFRKGVDPVKMLESISHFSGGGTNFDDPMGQAFKTIGDEKVFNKADIVFITDGSGAFNQVNELTIMKDKLETNVYSIILEYMTPEVLKNFSDRVDEINDLMDNGADKDVKEAIFSI